MDSSLNHLRQKQEQLLLTLFLFFLILAGADGSCVPVVAAAEMDCEFVAVEVAAATATAGVGDVAGRRRRVHDLPNSAGTVRSEDEDPLFFAACGAPAGADAAAAASVGPSANTDTSVLQPQREEVLAGARRALAFCGGSGRCWFRRAAAVARLDRVEKEVGKSRSSR